jgi:hypothetical protein
MACTMKFAALLALLLLGAVTAPASAAIVFTADLTNGQETTPAFPLTTSTGAPRPVSFGTASFTLNDAQTALSMSVSVFNIDITGSQTTDVNDNLVAAHIHAPAPPGVNGPVVWGFFGTPDNDNNPDNLVIAPFATDVGGVFTSVWNAPEGNGGTTLLAQLPNLLSGLAYLNFHTVQFPGGEIRGQINPVPEPSTLLLLGAACAIGLSRRLRISRRG